MLKCSTIKAVTHEKCENVIVGDTHVSCYEGPFTLPSFKELKSKVHWFFASDIGMWATGWMRDYVFSKPIVSSIRSVEKKTLV